jgi:signal transduction histidine kinase
MTEPVPSQAHPSGRTRRRAMDAAIALAVTAVQLAVFYATSSWGRHHHAAAPGWDVYLLLAVAGLAFVARRRYPVAVLAVSLGATLAAGKLGAAGMIWIALIAAFINAELAGKRVAAAVSLVIGFVSSVWPPWDIGRPGHTSGVAALGIAAWLLILLAIAELIRSRSQRAAALRSSQEEHFRRRASEDRVRIARDLHDVLAHNISVINVQANTALHLMDRQPERAKEALTAIHAVSKQVLGELRTVLGVLRDSADADTVAPRGPVPGLAMLPDLVSAVRSAGLDVHLTTAGERRKLEGEAGLAAYRIVQESLTNVTRHSNSSSADVRIGYGDAGIAVDVQDPGPASCSPVLRDQSAGNGIRGMAERAQELGGTLEAGPTAIGGFQVSAWLPSGSQAHAMENGEAS